jgi:hypothetical protein
MPERTEASMIWPRPENVSKVLHGVHGIFAEISSGTRSRRHSTSLNKERCVDVPVLAIPIGNADLVLHCDASREAIGSALYQRDAGGFLQPIEFMCVCLLLQDLVQRCLHGGGFKSKV